MADAKVLSEICGQCGLEVRTVALSGKWLHREPPADGHNIIFGTPTTREAYELGQRTIARRLAEEAGVKEESVEVPDPEVRATVITDDDPRMPGGAKRVINTARKAGWTVEATYARGPWLHSIHWTVTSISDHVKVSMRKAADAAPSRNAVATWRDGAFTTAWVWPTLRSVNSRDLAAYLKGE